MTKRVPVPPPGFEDLSIEEQIDYVQSLGGHIAADPSRVPVPPWHLDLLDERLAEYRADPDQSAPWEQVRDSLLTQLAKERSRDS
jgi:putative addiction module component (TIGR02574 family)